MFIRVPDAQRPISCTLDLIYILGIDMETTPRDGLDFGISRKWTVIDSLGDIS